MQVCIIEGPMREKMPSLPSYSCSMLHCMRAHISVRGGTARRRVARRPPSPVRVRSGPKDVWAVGGPDGPALQGARAETGTERQR
jgi:hypothetical protein